MVAHAGDTTARHWPPTASLVVWGLIGLATGFVVGGMGSNMAWTAGADGTTGNVRVELFGVVVRRGVGPEPVGPVRWTWGPAVLGTFALAGAGAAIAARTAVGRLLKEHRPSGR